MKSTTRDLQEHSTTPNPSFLVNEERAVSKIDEQPRQARDFRRENIPCLIIGAGPTGLSAGYHYGQGALILEKNATVGGWCRSLEDKGFTFDYAGHIMFSNDPYVLELYNLLLGKNVHWQQREAWVYSDGVYTRYPFQSALYGLPADVIKECVMGAIEARYPQAEHADVTTTEAKNDCATLQDCCADGSLPTDEGTSSGLPHETSENFEHFIMRTWGKGIGQHFALPYNNKLWKFPLNEMETSWLGGRVPLPDLEQIIEGALAPLAKPLGPNARFGYPLRGGFQALVSGFVTHLKCELETNAPLAELLPRDHRAILADGRTYHYEQLISTMPLPELIRLIGDKVPDEIREAANALRHVSVRCVNIGVGRENLTDKHWIYYAGDTIFHRIFVQGNASPFCNPPGGIGLTCEITYCDSQPLPLTDEALIERCLQDCIRVGIISAEDPIVTTNQVDMPYAYVIYDQKRQQNVTRIREWLLTHDIHLSGRYSEWEYYNSDHAFLAGRRVAEEIKCRGVFWRR